VWGSCYFSLTVVWLRPVTPEAPFRSQASPCEICGVNGGTGTGFSPSALTFPCQHDSNSDPYSSQLASYPCQEDVQAKPGNLPNRNAVSVVGEHWLENYVHFL